MNTFIKNREAPAVPPLPDRKAPMPKIIENVRQVLLAEARKQIAKHGYAATTVRSVARACGIAVGTVYNYFPSKEMLIASFMADDWRAATARMAEKPPRSAKEAFRQIYDLLCSFTAAHQALFTDADAAKAYAGLFTGRHPQLRGQLADMLLPFCRGGSGGAFLSQFLAEALLTWTMEGTPFEELCPVLNRLIAEYPTITKENEP